MITNKKRGVRLAASVRLHAASAGRSAAIAANEARAEAIKAGAQGGSREGITVAAVVEKELHGALRSIFAAYTEERSGILLDDPALRGVVRKGIEVMFDDAHPLLPDVPAFALNRQTYRDQIDEARVRALAEAEEHFRRPGMKPLIERFATQASVLSFVGGAIFTKLLDLLWTVLKVP